MVNETDGLDGGAVMGALLAFAQIHGGLNIKDLPDCWVAQVDAAWWVAANGHDTPRRCEPTAEHMGISLEPYHFAVWFHGWLAADLLPMGEGWFAAGAGANTATFIAALQAHV